ncbi:MAG: MarR family winged helix-turn-helix transcriptional regulator [Paludibacteraceae bacterium]
MNADYLNMKEPVGRIMSKIGKMSQELLQTKLSYLDIDRSFYPLLLIESHCGMTQQELADELTCNKVQVVRIIDYLSYNGYVQRMPNLDDRRKYQLTVTEKAQKVIPEIRKVMNEVFNISFQGITQIQIDDFYVLLYQIETNLTRQLNYE